MPAANPIIQLVKILFMINLIFSYPLIIYITNIILESYIFKSWKKATSCRKWSKNLQRTIVLLLGIIAAMYLKDCLDKVLALSGTLLGTTVVLIIPTLCHQKLLAKTMEQSIVNIAILCISGAILIVCTTKIIIQW